MAISFVGVASYATTASTTDTSFTTPLPSGVVAGDVLILMVADGSDPGTLTGPSGWTLLGRTVDTGTAPAEAGVTIYWKPATGSDAAPSVSCTTSSRFVAHLSAYRGVDNTSPFLTQNAAAETGSSTTTVHTAPTLTNTNASAWGLYALASRQVATPYTATPGAGLTERADLDVGNAGTTNTLGYWADSNGTVATGSVTYSATGSSGSAIAVMWAGLLAPAAAAFSGSAALSGSGSLSATGIGGVTVTETWTGTDGAAWPAQWTATGTGASHTIQGNTGQQSCGTSTARAYVPGMATITDFDITATVDFTANLAGAQAGISVGGYIADFWMANGYTLLIAPNWPNAIRLYKTDGTGSSTNLATAAFTYTASTVYNLRFTRVGGLIRGKIWTGSTEPGDYTLSYTDGSPQPAGRVQLSTYGNGSAATVQWDSLTLTGTSSTVLGSGSLSGSGALSGSGVTAAAAGSGSLSGSGGLSASGPAGARGTGSLSGSGALSGSGVVGGAGSSGIAVDAAHATLAEVASATAITATVPTGVVNGDLLMLSVAVAGAFATTSLTGWTPILSSTADAGDAEAVWYRVASSEPASYTFSGLLATAGRISAEMVRVTGVDPVTPLDTTAVANTGTGVTAPTVTTVSAGAAIFYAVSADAATAADLSSPAGVTTITDTTGTGKRLLTAYEIQPTPGTSASRVFPESGTTVSATAITVALKPATPQPIPVALSGAGSLSASGTSAGPVTPASISFIGAAANATAAGASETTHTGVIPTGVIAGDLLILSLVDGSDPGTLTGPAGWTFLRRTVDTATAPAEAGLSTYWTRATGSDAAPVISCTSASRFVATVAAYRGVDTTMPFLVENAAAEAGSSSTAVHSAPALTNSVDGAWGLYALGSRQVATPYTATAGAGLTERSDLDLGNAGTTNTMGYWADSAGPVANGATVTYSATGSAGSAVAVMWAALLKPGSVPVTDTTPPSVPGGVTATATAASSVTVSWTASSDDTGVASYRVLRGGTTVAAAATATSFTDTTVGPSTSYSYTISAVDAAGNRSAESAPATVTTPPGVVRMGANGGFGTAGSVAQVNPAGVAVGDLLLVQVHNSTTGNAIATPTGWSVLLGPIADAQTGDGWHYVFTRFADGTAADAPTWTSAGATDHMAYLVIVARGADPSTPINASASAAGTGSPTSGPAMNTTVTNCLVLNWVGDSHQSSVGTAPRFTPVDTTNWTDGLDVGVQSTAPSLSLHSTYLYQASAGVVPPQSYTQSSTTNGYVLTQVAIAPAGAAPPAGTLTLALVGTPDGSSCPVKVKTAGAASVRLQVDTDPSLTGAPFFTAAQTPDSYGYTAHSIGGLAAGTTYYYGVEVDGTVAGSVFRFTTDTPSTPRNFRVAFGSCLLSGSTDGTAFSNITANNPEVFIHLGDWDYDNSTSTNQATHQASLENQILGNGAFSSLLQTVPLAYAWSDHDSGNNNWSGGPGVQTPSYLAAYAEVIPVAGTLPAGGIYRSFGRGRVKFILTDSRSFKSLDSAPDDANKTMFGFTQEAWIANELADPNYPVKVICTDVPWVAAPTAGEDNWGGFTTASARLVSAIQSAGAHVFLIHGDSHMLAADNGSSPNNPGHLPMACAAPFGNTASIKGGPYSQGTWPTFNGSSVEQHGLLDITDTGDAITIRYSGRDSTNVERVTLTQTWQIGTAALTGSGTLDAQVSFGSSLASGSGTLTAGGAYGPVDVAAFGGSGGLAPAAPVLGLTLSGAGALSASGTPGERGAAALSGTGSLAAAGSPRTAGAGALSASGALVSGVGAPTAALSRALTGTGTLTIAGQAPAMAVTLALAGTGTLAAATVAHPASTPAYTGVGTLAVGTAVAFLTTLAFSGSGTLAVNTAPAIARATALSGAGTLAPVGIALMRGAPALSGAGTLVVAGVDGMTPGYALILGGGGLLAFAGAVAAARSTPGLTGAGQLAVIGNYPDGTGRPGATASTVFTGSGALSAAAATLLEHGVGTLSGIGTLAGVGVRGGLATLTLSGTGALAVAPIAGQAGPAALLAGVGTLSTADVAGGKGAAALLGAGTLAVAILAGSAGTGTLSGAGALTAGTPTVVRLVSTALAGAGTLVVAVTPRPVVGLYYALSGSGTLSFAGGIYGFTPTAMLSGTGVLSTAVSEGLTRAASLTGAGALALAVLVGPHAAAVFAGSGALGTPTRLPNATPSPQLVGSGTVVVAPRVIFGGNVATSGVGALARVSAAQLAAQANTSALGTLFAAGTSFAGTAAASGLGVLAIVHASSRIVRSAYRLDVEPAPPMLLVRPAPPSTQLVAGPSHPR